MSRKRKNETAPAEPVSPGLTPYRQTLTHDLFADAPANPTEDDEPSAGDAAEAEPFRRTITSTRDAGVYVGGAEPPKAPTSPISGDSSMSRSNPPDSDTASTATGAGSAPAGAEPPVCTGHKVLPNPALESALHAAERLAFIDQAAIARFGQGYPVSGCYREAVKLWDAREAFLQAEAGKR